MSVTVCQKVLDAIEDASAVICVTDWACFRDLDMQQVLGSTL